MKNQTNKCINIDTLHAFANNKLDSEDNLLIKKHLVTCEDCAEIVEDIKWFAKENPEQNSKEYVQKNVSAIFDKMEQNLTKRQKIKTFSMLGRYAAASIALFIIIGSVFWLNRTTSQNQYFEDSLLAYSALKATTRGEANSNQIEYLYKGEKFDAAIQLAEKELKTINKESGLYLYTYAMLILSYHGDKQHEKALESAKYISTHTNDKSFQKNIKKEMFRLYLEKGDKKEAEKLLNELKSNGIDISELEPL